MENEEIAQQMVVSSELNPIMIRQRIVYVQFSNHKELKTDNSPNQLVRAFLILTWNCGRRSSCVRPRVLSSWGIPSFWAAVDAWKSVCSSQNYSHHHPTNSTHFQKSAKKKCRKANFGLTESDIIILKNIISVFLILHLPCTAKLQIRN